MNGVVIHLGSVESLRPITEAWYKEARGSAFGIAIDREAVQGDLQRLANGPQSTLLVLRKEDQPIGYLGIELFQSPVGPDLVANEHYYYVHPDHRGLSSIRLIDGAKVWAKAMGAQYMLFSASNLASDLHDSVCKLYERKGMNKFETVFFSAL